MISNKQGEKLKVTHVFHSGVILETEQDLLVIDYYHDKDSFDHKDFINYLKQQNHKDFYYFVTHGHEDHFTKDIFSLPYQSLKGSTRYILSEDLANYKNSHPSITLCRPYQEFEVSGLIITTFGSTDKGVSYLIKVKSRDILIFHSGDLNWWHWKHFSQDEQLQEKKDFLQEIHKLKTHLTARNLTPDIAFVPVDPRLEEFYYLAGKAFLEEIQPKKMFPLHFRDDYDVTKKFEEQYAESATFERVTRPMETFILAD